MKNRNLLLRTSSLALALLGSPPQQYGIKASSHDRRFDEFKGGFWEPKATTKYTQARAERARHKRIKRSKKRNR